MSGGEEQAAPAEARGWWRKCNGAEPGCPATRDEAEWAAGLPGVTGTVETGLAWTVDDHGGKRHFTIYPLDEPPGTAT
jgi:hypothetical protein